ncbi:AraC family transcriptional regulator [Cellulosilyticum sp. I15G10I2]|uniref:AraC family transcriptional regulator n=1 Tax=Cellulosilyticum sp. I15G10I2 TaxID=1892843 RepID=UPI00085C400E|nr:AraC family transcriptional regulator [Cellulosilyticum sp. I15G10I2]
MRKTLFEEIIDGMIINRVVRDSEFTMPAKHFHNEYEIYYLLKGERYYFIENETYLVNEGSLVFINHNQIHKTGSVSEAYHDRIVIELRSDYLAPFFASVGDFSLENYFSKYYGVLHLDSKSQSYVENLLFDIVKEIQNKAPGYKLAAYTKLTELLIYAMRLQSKENVFSMPKPSQKVKHQKIHELTLYITENYAQIQSLDDLAKYFYISKCYLSRLFKEVTGFTVNEYISICKIKKAQELLISSDYNISEITSLLGYNSITSFEKAFKKYTETTPLKYRKKMLAVTYQLRDRKQE